MSDNFKEKKPPFLERILNKKAIILILIGFILRLIMLFYYYYSHYTNPSKSWGDVQINYNLSEYYPPLTMLLLYLFKILSFGMVEVFAFWAFLFDILITIVFYFVLSSFDSKNKNYVYGLFLVNPFLFLNNVFSFENCGYHITDSFFFLFLFLALYYFPKGKIWYRYLFYSFLAFSLVAKLYTLPILVFFLIKFLIAKDWKELKIFAITTIPIIFVFLISPIFYWENYLELYLFWNLRSQLPLYIRLIPVAIISLIYIFFRIKKAGIIEITFLSILVMAVFMFFSNPYLRYFQALLMYGILTPYVFFSFTLNLGFIKRKIIFDNNLLVFYSSFILVGLAYLIIIFVL